MAALRLIASPDPEALLLHAAEPFLHDGRPHEPLPLLAVRHAALREEVMDRAALAGCVGWIGDPLAVFRELPGRIAEEHAPLSSRERHVLLARLIRELRLEHLLRMLSSSRSPAPVDGLIGDLRAERVAPERLAAAFAALRGDRWERERDAEMVRLYQAYGELIPTLPTLNGLPRSDGRDGLALAAQAVRERPHAVRSRLARPFRDPAEPIDLRLLGLMDLRRGWRLLLDALREAPFVGDLAVYLPGSLDAREPAELWEFLAPRAEDTLVLEPAGGAPGIAALAASLFGDAAGTVEAPEVTGLAAPDADREVEAIARQVKERIVERGAAPHRIVVVARQANPYVPAMAEALRRVGVPVSARLRSRLLRVPAVGAYLALFRLAAEGSSLRALLNLAESPYFKLDLDIRVLTWIGGKGRPESLQAWELAIARLGAAPEDDPDADRSAPRPERARRALERFAEFRETMERFAASRPLSEWIALARALLEDDGQWGFRRRAVRLPGTAEDPLAVDAVRVDVAGVRVLEGVLETWRRALALDPGQDAPLDAAGWLATLADALEGVEIEITTANQSGVRVVEASAALGLPRDHLFVVGMSSGAFPAEPPPRTLYTAAERKRLAGAGLPLETDDHWFDREASLFRVLLSTARHTLVASHAYAGAEGQVQLPSAYFEELRERLAGDGAWCERVPGSRLVPPSLRDVWSRSELWRFGARAWAMGEAEASPAAMAHLAARDPAGVDHVLRMAAVERARPLGEGPRPERAHPHNGAIRDQELLTGLRARFADGVWSVSRLESYGLCPWQFFARQILRLESLEEPEDDVDAMTRGALLHDCLEAIHRRLVEAHDETALESDHLPEVEAMLDGVLDEVVGRHAARGWLGTEELRLPRVRELRRTLLRYVRWEMEQNESTHHNTPPRRKPLTCELVFGMEGQPPVALTRGGRTLLLRGRIDRVDEIVAGPARGWRYVVDHKSGTGSIARGRYDVGALLQLPLYMKVLEADGGTPVWGGAYHGMNDLSRAAPLHPHKDDRPGVTKTALAAAARVEAALDHAFRHVDGILAGHFPAALPPPIVDPETDRLSDPVRSCPPYCDFRDVCRHYIEGEEGG